MCLGVTRKSLGAADREVHWNGALDVHRTHQRGAKRIRRPARAQKVGGPRRTARKSLRVLELPAQCVAVDPEDLGGPVELPASGGKHLLDVAPLDFLERQEFVRIVRS